jgi:DNA-directed RNA polymerase specialized sigma24 family protein
VSSDGADHAVWVLYARHYRSLVRLAAFLVPDTATAEQVVQDSFAQVAGDRRNGHWPRAADTLTCLRKAVLSRARRASAADPAAHEQASPLLAALARLPPQQREVIVLRYYADLPEAEAAAVLGITKAQVHTAAAGALAALRTTTRPRY